MPGKSQTVQIVMTLRNPFVARKKHTLIHGRVSARATTEDLSAFVYSRQPYLPCPPALLVDVPLVPAVPTRRGTKGMMYRSLYVRMNGSRSASVKPVASSLICSSSSCISALLAEYGLRLRSPVLHEPGEPYVPCPPVVPLSRTTPVGIHCTSARSTNVSTRYG